MAAVTPISVREYARRRGVSHVTVLNRIKSGKIPTTSDGKIDPRAADAAWKKNHDPDRQLRKDVAPNSGHIAAESMSPGPAAAGTEPISELREYRTKRELIRLQKETLDLGLLKKRLIDSDEVAAAWSGMITRAKNMLLAIPDELGDILASEYNPIRCRELLRGKIEKALVNLAENPSGA